MAVAVAVTAVDSRVAVTSSSAESMARGHAQAWPFVFARQHDGQGEMPVRFRWLGLMVLCGWQASFWLAAPITEQIPVLMRALLASILLAVFSVASFLLRRPGRISQDVVWKLAAAGLMMLTAPAILLHLAGEQLPETSTSVIFALAPLVVLLTRGAASDSPGRASALVPALVGVAGVLLVLPFEASTSFQGVLALAEALGAMLLSAVGAVWLHLLLRDQDLQIGMEIIAAANALALALYVVVAGALPMTGWNLPAACLTVAQAAMLGLVIWLAAVMDPVAFSSRFLWVPLLGLLEGALLVRAGWTLRYSIGTLLMLAGAVWLLRPASQVDDEVLSLR